VPTYLVPDVYIEEVSLGVRPIQAVGTSTPGFVGEAPNGDGRLNEIVSVTNWSQFVKEFVGDGGESTPLSHAVYGFFQNGGGRCFVVNVGRGQPIVGDGRRRAGLDLLEQVDEIGIVAAPGYTDPAAYDAIIAHCEKLKDRVAILDAPRDVEDISLLTEVAVAATPGGKEKGSGEASGGRRGLRPRQSDDGYGAFYVPWLVVRDPLQPSILATVPPHPRRAGRAESKRRQLHSLLCRRRLSRLGGADHRQPEQPVALPQRPPALVDDRRIDRR
jgi:hypothetical protein